jgi:hypothetical protein
VTAQNPSVPYIVNGNEIEIGSAQALATALESMLTELFQSDPTSNPPSSFTLKLGCRYAQPLTVADGDGHRVVSYLPVVNVPLYTLDGSTQSVTALASQISSYVTTTWAPQAFPREADGDAYVFDVSLFNPGAGAGSVTRPLIELTNLCATFAPTNGHNGNGTGTAH